MAKWPDRVDNETMASKFKSGPKLTSNAVLVMLGSVAGGRIYKREGNYWYLLEDKPRHSTPEEGEHGS